MRRVAVIMTFLAGLIALSVATPARTETRRALEAEARKHGAPMVWIKDGAFTMGSQDGLSKTQPPHEGDIRNSWRQPGRINRGLCRCYGSKSTCLTTAIVR
ncbi:MAG: hypothetical protein E6K69_07795 [Nitrospirae bacterium]|nr:MAG: hypothetical protein E6K69_07795 [Nitrospirota bacterium]